MWYIVALAACVAGDQLLKWWVVSHLEVGQSAPLLPGVMQLTRLHNTGAAWSSFSGKTGLLAIVTIVLMLAVAWLLMKRIVRHPLGVTAGVLILGGGIAYNGFKGVGSTLKEFSLPISMSFRLFGALLSGLLVTELVYYSLSLSFVLPVFVGVMFTLLHALIQTYVLTTLLSIFYGEVTEPHTPKPQNA